MILLNLFNINNYIYINNIIKIIIKIIKFTKILCIEFFKNGFYNQNQFQNNHVNMNFMYEICLCRFVI